MTALAVGGEDPRFGWAIVGALSLTVTVSYGVLTYAFGIVLVPMQRDLGWSRLDLSAAFSLALVVSSLAGIVVGAILDRYSPRILLTAGSVFGALLVLAWSEVRSLSVLYLAFGGLGLAMAALFYNSAFVVVTKWFHTRRRQALTTVTVAGAFSSLIFSPLTERLTVFLGWRGALVVLALILAVVTVPLNGLVLRPAPPLAGPDNGEPSHIATGVLRLRGFWLLVVSMAFGNFTWSAIVVHLVAFLIGQGRSPEFAAFAAGLVGIGQLPGRLLFASFGQILQGGRLPMASFSLGALALALLAIDQSPSSVVIFAITFGMGGGMLTLMGASVPAELYGRLSYGTVSGVMYACSNAARAIAPFLGAAVTLLPGRYTTLIWLLVLLSVLGALLGRAAVQSRELRL